MKKVILSLLFLSVIHGLLPAKNNYLTNRAPLEEVPFIALPVGAVRAEGWLLKQLELQKSGLTGNAELLYNSKNDLGPDNDWLGGPGDSWERAPYYTKGLVALAYVLNDKELIQRAQKWIDWSIDNQRSDGFFGPEKNTDWWARMPMLYAIRDYYDATGDKRVIPFFTRYFKYQNENIEVHPLSSWGKARAGDNIEIVFWLYNHTGDAFLLELADKLHHQAYPWTDIYTNNRFNQFGTDFMPKHNVNVPQAMKLPVVYWLKSHSEADRQAFTRGRGHLLCDHGQPNGMSAGSEMLNGKSSMNGLELCSVVEQMQSSQTAQMILGDASIGDQLEQVAFNALPGGLTHDIKGLQYYQLANQVISKRGYAGFAQNYDNGHVPGPFSGYGCCRFDFHMGYPYFVKTMWAATADQGLAVMAYGPSRVTARVGKGTEVTIREVTDYPFRDNLSFTLSTSQKVKFPLKFRIPAWCESPEISVNGVAQSGITSGSFYTIHRTWKNNDVVSIRFPMKLVVNNEVNNAVSIHRGPLVFSLKIKEKWSVVNSFANDFHEHEVTPESPWNYALLIDKTNPEKSIQVVESAMPANPFEQANAPVKLLVNARLLPSWMYNHTGRLATDPPYGPVTSTASDEQVTLIPYGAETLRATSLPYIDLSGRSSSCEKHSCKAFSEDFEKGSKGWVEYGGSWYVKDGAYVAANVEASHPASKSVFPATSVCDFSYEADVKIRSGNGDAGIIFRASRIAFGPDDYNGYYAGINTSNQLVLGKADGAWHALATVPVKINPSTTYRLKVEAKGSSLKIYVDDMSTPKIEFSDASFSSGTIGIRSYNTVAQWDNLIVNLPEQAH